MTIIDTIKKDRAAQIAISAFLFLSLWWVYLRFTTAPNNIQNQFFAASYGVMALWGGLWGLTSSKKWGGFRSVLGRSILMFSLGLLFQEFGQITYSYYIYFAKIEVPYPSIGDIGYFGSIPLYIYGVWLLAKVAGVNIAKASIFKKFLATLIPILMVTFAYFLFLQGYEFDWSSPLTIFLDFGYPFFQAIYVSLAIITYLLSKKVLGGIMKAKVLLILFALVVQFYSDYTFLYQALRGTWYAGGTNDFIYLVSYTLMTLALFQLKNTASKLNN